MLKLVKVITNKKFINNNKKEINVNFLAIQFENGRYIPIQPIYDDYDVLNFHIEKVIDLRKSHNDEK